MDKILQRIKNNNENPYTLILNPINKPLTKSFLDNTFKLLRVSIKPYNVTDFQYAFVHPSYSTQKNERVLKEFPYSMYHKKTEKLLGKVVPIQEKNYETYEFYGDTVINWAASRYIIEKYPNRNEDFYSRIRSNIVSTSPLAEMGAFLGFPEYIMISGLLEDGKGHSLSISRNKDVMVSTNGRSQEGIIEDVVEAFFGVLSNYITMEECYDAFVYLIEQCIDIHKIEIYNQNYKDQLLRIFQKRNRGSKPSYHKLTIEGREQEFIPPELWSKLDEMKKQYEHLHFISVHDTTGDMIGMGFGNTKKNAEQMAAYQALVFYEVLE